jgi:hypothetical protein
MRPRAVPAGALSVPAPRSRSWGNGARVVVGAMLSVLALTVWEAGWLDLLMALVAGLHGNRGCEITAVANVLRGRDDKIGCPLFEPFDALDGRGRT